MQTSPSSPQQEPTPVPFEAWPEAIETVLRTECALFQRVRLLRDVASTQDEARVADARIGDVTVAWRQHAGRGRLGRPWADTAEDGVAITFTAPSGAPERLACASAVAAARTVIEFGGDAARAGIKWPNDIVVDGRKVCGILIEQSGGTAFIGIGCNVRQRSFAPPLEQIATSLACLGVQVDRLVVVCALLRNLDAALRCDAEAIFRTYRQLDRLTGTEARLQTPAGVVQGRILQIDPFEGLLVQTADGPCKLPAATTSVIPPEAACRYGVADGPT